jgi:phenylalanyl-tRNA synthetase beta chain
MKVSLNEIKRLGYEDVVSIPVDELVEKIGAQLGAVEDVEDLGAKYQGVVVARVVSCEDHPNADRLHVCKIDDGGAVENIERDERGHVQVVCGAPNVREGLLVAWLPPGSTVPETYHHEAPFKLDARELRGVVSNGMLASPKELALSDDHEGILEIETEAQPGTPFANVYGLDDHVIDIENKMFTHRPDCFGLLGVARELAGIQHKPFTSPEWYLHGKVEDGEGLELSVVNEVQELVPRFVAVAMQNVKVSPSPMWLQTALLRLGSRPINNVVDITNYVMLITGQPLHAYDYDKVATKKLGVRMGHENEKLALLNGKEITLTNNDIVITDGEKPIGLGGVMGGSETEVDDNTTSIILECANFDMYAIRRASMRHGLFTDAVTRFNKGQSPLQNDRVVAHAIGMFQELAGGQVASNFVDDNRIDDQRSVVDVSTDFVNTRLGLELSADDMATLLKNVEFAVDVHDNELNITPPFWRTDIEIPEDTVEEIGRLYGYDRLPLVLPKRDITPANRNALLDLKSKARNILSRSGANEVLTYSFVHGDLLKKVGQDSEQAYQVSNALSPDLQYYRLSVFPSLLDKVHPNIKAGYDEFALFEIGKSHQLDQLDDEGLPAEFETLDLVYAASDKITHQNAAYYHARQLVQELADKLNIDVEFKPAGESNHPGMKPFDTTRSATIAVKGTDMFLGLVGELKSSVRKSLKLPVHTAVFSIGLQPLLDAVDTMDAYSPLSRYPSSSQDICLRVKSDTRYADVLAVFETGLTDSPYTWKLEPIDIYQGDDKSAKQITIRVTLNNVQATLTTDEVQAAVSRIVDIAREKLGAEHI